MRYFSLQMNSESDLKPFLDSVPDKKKLFYSMCKEREAYKFGDFTLRSGLKSNIFFNSAVLTDCESFDLMTDLLVAKLIESDVDFNALFGCPYKAIPIVSVVCLKYYKLTGKKVFFGYHRKQEKDHGEGKLFVGSPKVFESESRLVVVDDILTKGTSVSDTLQLLKSTEATVVSVLILINRETNYGEFARELESKNIKYFEVMKLEDIVSPGSYYTVP